MKTIIRNPNRDYYPSYPFVVCPFAQCSDEKSKISVRCIIVTQYDSFIGLNEYFAMEFLMNQFQEEPKAPKL